MMRESVSPAVSVYPERTHDEDRPTMTPDWIAAMAGAAAFLTSLVVGMKVIERLDEIKRSIGGRLTESVATVGREQRAIGILEGAHNEQLDHQAELERTRAHSILVTELPSQERCSDGNE